MDGMNIYTVLVTRLLPITDLTMDRVGFKSLSGYRRATLDKGLTNKEIHILAGPKYRQIRHTFSHFWARNWPDSISTSLYDAPAILKSRRDRHLCLSFFICCRDCSKNVAKSKGHCEIMIR
jgi:hypothetical protein